MKNLSFVIVLMLSFCGLQAQRFAYVDSEYILSNIPSYKSAQEQIEKYSNDWEAEVKKMMDEVEKQYKDFQAEKVLLTDEMRAKREESIINKEKQLKELQKKYFGPGGELFMKREELMKPIQDEVYKAIKEMAVEGNFALILDTSSGPNILYSNPKYDKSDDVLIKLGYKN